MRKRLKIISLALGMAVMSAGLATTSHAALSSGFTSRNFRPAISNKTDYFVTYSSQTVGARGWNAGFYLDVAKNPLEFGSPPGTRQSGVTDWTIIGNFYGTYGILDWMSVGLNIPVFFYNDVRPLLSYGPTATFGAFDPQTNLGDIRFELKFRVRNNEDRLVGIALRPYMTLPSGPSSTFAGNGSLTGGLDIIVDFNISDRVKLALNVGYLARDDVTILNARIDDQIPMALGLSIKIIERLMFIAEANTQPVLRNFFGNEVQTPAEAMGGFRIKATDHLDVNVGGGAGLTIGIGSPDWRGFLGLNYNWVPAPCPACEAPAVVAKKITIDQKIHFAFDRSVIRPQSYPILNDVASIIKNNQDSISNVMIEGNTDSIGSDAYNMKLSERRANSVRSYLVKEGVPANILDTVGYGESRPIATNTTAEGRAQNRRVEFKVNSK